MGTSSENSGALGDGGLVPEEELVVEAEIGWH